MGKFSEAYEQLRANTDNRKRTTLERNAADKAAHDALSVMLENLLDDSNWDAADHEAYARLQRERLE